MLAVPKSRYRWMFFLRSLYSHAVGDLSFGVCQVLFTGTKLEMTAKVVDAGTRAVEFLN